MFVFPGKKAKLTEGVEFKDISRATLLKLLAGFEEKLIYKARAMKTKPVFTAQFANNQHTFPFIYPAMIKRHQKQNE